MELVKGLLDLLYPRRCAFCHRITPYGEPLCKSCAGKLPLTLGLEQRQKLSHIPICVSPLRYEGDVRRSLLRYKFQGRREYAKIYGDFLSKCIDENEISCDIITWVPLSARRLRRRGYDQARLVAEELAAKRGVPCAALLRKIRDNPAQSGTGSPEKRRANVAGAYTAVNESAFRGKEILLIDDVMTTGATISECARVLKTAGAGKIYAAAVAKVR